MYIYITFPLTLLLLELSIEIIMIQLSNYFRMNLKKNVNNTIKLNHKILVIIIYNIIFIEYNQNS